MNTTINRNTTTRFMSAFRPMIAEMIEEEYNVYKDTVIERGTTTMDGVIISQGVPITTLAEFTRKYFGRY